MSNMSLLLDPEPFPKFGVGGGGRWSKGILEFRFGPSLGLRLEARTKLNNFADIEFVWWWVVGFVKSFSCQSTKGYVRLWF